MFLEHLNNGLNSVSFSLSENHLSDVQQSVGWTAYWTQTGLENQQGELNACP